MSNTSRPVTSTEADTSSSRTSIPPTHSQSHQPQQSSSSQHLPSEERLGKLWRHLASATANFMIKAEKAAAESTQANCKDLDGSVVTFLKTRMEWHRLISHVEAKLQGKAQEMEALECYVRTQPRLGKRKRMDDTMDSVAKMNKSTDMTASVSTTNLVDLVPLDS